MHSALLQKYRLIMTVYSKFADMLRISARHFVKYAHGQGLVNARLQVSYARQEHTDAGITMHDNSWVQAEKNRLAESITVARMNRLIKSCGMSCPACPVHCCCICSCRSILFLVRESSYCLISSIVLLLCKSA
jgi:hypothetical protein